MYIVKHFIVVILFAFIFVEVAAQSDETEAKLHSLLGKSNSFRIKTAHRMTTISERSPKKGGPVISESVQITDVLPPSSRHSINEYTFGDKKSKFETIFVAGKSFHRRDDGDWFDCATAKEIGLIVEAVINDRSSRLKETPLLPLNSLKVANTYKYEGKAMLNGLPLDVYVKNTTSTYSEEVGNYKTTQITKYWFNENGILIKQFIESGSSLSDNITRITITYEFDTDLIIKIEPPIK